jgi:hypothetical protein
MVGVQEMRDSAAVRSIHRDEALGGHRARAGGAPGVRALRRADNHGRPLMAQLLGDLIKRLKIQLNLTSIVVTHDMRLAKKLAERVMFLYEAKAIFSARIPQWRKIPIRSFRSFWNWMS